MNSKARNEAVAVEFKEISLLLDDDKISDAQEKLKILRNKIGGIPSVLKPETEAQSLEWLKKEDSEQKYYSAQASSLLDLRKIAHYDI